MQLEILALIPARSGSKRIPHKNIRTLNGKPLLAHSIEHARASTLINRVMVSTDSAEYAAIAREYGAETPFLRPPELAQDLSTDLETFEHALEWLQANENYTPDICVHLRPTYPIRQVSDIDAMIRVLIERPEVDSVRSIAVASETPYKMWLRSADGYLSPAAPSEIRDAYNLPGQMLPTAYLQNACIDVVRTRVILEQKSMSGRRIYGYVMPDNYDIDTEAQLGAVASKFEIPSMPVDLSSNPRTVCFDIDGVIATLTPNNQYDQSQPCQEAIDLINRLYAAGHRIILFTARGSATGLNWSTVTKQQLSDWGVLYHQLLFGKPAADYYVDDRAVTFHQLAESL